VCDEGAPVRELMQKNLAVYSMSLAASVLVQPPELSRNLGDDD